MRKIIWVLVAAVSLGMAVPAEAAGDLSPAANQKYLAAYAAQPGVVTRASGLMYRVKKTGTGTVSPKTTDGVVVAYSGKLIDGETFDRRPPSNPIAFVLDQLIPGWIEAISLMKVGDQWEIVVPSSLGYGSEGKGAAVPPNQTLVFDIELMGIQALPPAPPAAAPKQ